MSTITDPTAMGGIAPTGRAWFVTDDTVAAALFIANERAQGATVTAARYWGNEWHAVVEIDLRGHASVMGVYNLFDKDDAPWWQQIGLSAAEITEATA